MQARRLAYNCSEMPYQVLTRNQHFELPGPKRILALDGGGLRGILTLGILERVEELLRARHGADFRLCHYFDLIAGTSTGAIIAAALATGMTVAEVISHYQRLGNEVFEKSWSRDGVLRARYDAAKLSAHLQEVFGDRTLGDESLKTGLLIMTKRLDTGSPWPLGNNPRGRYFQAKPEDKWISNGDYPLWKVVRASTAAPSYFDPETMTIAEEPGKKVVAGTFVDGGVSPFNNPSLQALMYATLEGYRVGWATGADQLLLVSVGTGMAEAGHAAPRVAAEAALKSLLSLTDDCASLVETMMQWLSSSPTARKLDREIGTLGNDLLAGTPKLSYLRYNSALSVIELSPLLRHTSIEQLASLGEMDNTANLDVLLELGRAVGRRDVQDVHFPGGFDLGN